MGGYVHHVVCEAEKASLQSSEIQGKLFVLSLFLNLRCISGQGDTVYLYNKFPFCVFTLAQVAFHS